MTKKKKVLLVGGIVLVVAIILIAFFQTGGEQKTSVTVEPVKTQDLNEEVSASGYVQPRTKVNITAEVTAKIINLPVVEGQTARKGQLLVLLDTVQLQKDVEQARFSLQEMESRTSGSEAIYLQAKEEFDRQKQLFERQLTSETSYKNAEYAFLNYKYSHEAMLSQTSQSRAYYEKALDNLEKASIRAPMDGVITFLDAEVGEIAPAQNSFTQGKTLMTISNLAAFEVQVDVDETEIIKIRQGQASKIEVDAFPDTVFVGEVIEIGNTAVMSGVGTQDQTTNFRVKVLFEKAHENIRPGMSATVDIETNTRKGALTVPYGAIVMRNPMADSLTGKSDTSDTSGGLVASVHAASDQGDTSTSVDDSKKKEVRGVFVIRDGAAKFLEVTTGIADQKNIEIVSGLTQQDTVVTGPFRTLRTIKSGDRVQIEEKPKAGM